MSEGVLERRWQPAIRLTVAGLVWSVGLVLAALLIGAYSGQTVSSDAGVTLTTRSFVQVNGLKALVLVAIRTPVVILLGLSARLVPGPPPAPAPARSPGSPAIDS